MHSKRFCCFLLLVNRLFCRNVFTVKAKIEDFVGFFLFSYKQAVVYGSFNTELNFSFFFFFCCKISIMDKCLLPIYLITFMYKRIKVANILFFDYLDLAEHLEQCLEKPWNG